jgi:CubicO group peptidase (beta-lactamase class C family)
LPYCDRQRFGVWSVTKSAADSLALLHLAQKYGPEIYGTKFVDLVPEAAGRDGWEDVTLDDMVSMTSGMARPDATEDEEPWDASYYAWYEAPTVAAKLDATLSTAKPYAWGPGARMRYRDEDIFLLGVAMTRYLQACEGPGADVWTMLEQKVFRPIGIHVAPINKTIEADGSAGQPLMAFGYYPTIGDLVKIARLYQDGGRHGDAQLLDADRVGEIMSNRPDLGFETGGAHRSRYLHSFWRASFASRGGCEVSYPSMVGWGDNFVSLFPHDVIVIRLAKDWDGEGNSGSSTSLESTVDQLVELCGN